MKLEPLINYTANVFAGGRSFSISAGPSCFFLQLWPINDCQQCGFFFPVARGGL